MSADLGPNARGGSAFGVLGSSALAALAVVALVGVLILAFGERADRTDAAVFQAPPAVVAPIAAPSAAPSAVPARSPSPIPTPTAAAERAEVVVFNQTTQTGLAAEFQERLQEAGWRVPAVDDFRGTVPATTVYFPPGLRAAAQALKAEFPEVGRIRPAFAGIPEDQLSVVLADDFPGANSP